MWARLRIGRGLAVGGWGKVLVDRRHQPLGGISGLHPGVGPHGCQRPLRRDRRRLPPHGRPAGQRHLQEHRWGQAVDPTARDGQLQLPLRQSVGHLGRRAGLAGRHQERAVPQHRQRRAVLSESATWSVSNPRRCHPGDPRRCIAGGYEGRVFSSADAGATGRRRPACRSDEPSLPGRVELTYAERSRACIRLGRHQQRRDMALDRRRAVVHTPEHGVKLPVRPGLV